MSVYRDTTTSHDITTDAGFRAWAQAIHDAFTSVGLVNTSDTGQINLTTVTTPGSNNTFGGYEIWRFNDTNQGGDPIYFKIEYGRAGGASVPKIQVTVGTGSNGSGTISGATSSFTNSASTAPSGSPELHVCLIDGCLVFYDAWVASSANGWQFWTIERFRDAAGAVITSGGNRGNSIVTGGNIAVGLVNERKGATWNTRVPAPLGYGSGAQPDGRKRLSPFCCGDNHPGIGFMLAKSGEITAGDTGAASIYGTSHTYRAMAGTISASTITTIGSTANITPLLVLLSE